MTKEEADRIIRQQDLLGSQEMFRLVGQGGSDAQLFRSSVNRPNVPSGLINIANFANPRRKKPMSYEFLGQPFRSAYTGR